MKLEEDKERIKAHIRERLIGYMKNILKDSDYQTDILDDLYDEGELEVNEENEEKFSEVFDEVVTSLSKEIFDNLK